MATSLQDLIQLLHQSEGMHTVSVKSVLRTDILVRLSNLLSENGAMAFMHKLNMEAMPVAKMPIHVRHLSQACVDLRAREEHTQALQTCGQSMA